MLILVRKKNCQKTSSHDTAISPQECCKAHFVSQGHTPGMPCILNLTTTHQTPRSRHGTICNFPFQESILFDRSLSLIAKQRRLPYNPPLIYLKKNLLQIASRWNCQLVSASYLQESCRTRPCIGSFCQPPKTSKPHLPSNAFLIVGRFGKCVVYRGEQRVNRDEQSYIAGVLFTQLILLTITCLETLQRHRFVKSCRWTSPSMGQCGWVAVEWVYEESGPVMAP